MRKTIIITLLLVFSFSISFAQNSEAELTQKLEKLFKESTAKGGALAILSEEGALYTNAFGYADEEKKRLYTTKTVQPIASISKTLLGISFMKAQEMGLLRLDDNINQYLPFSIVNPHHPNQVITLRHLASHSAGIKDTKHYDKAYIFDEKSIDFHKNFKFGLKRKLIKKYMGIYNSNVDMPIEQFLANIYSKEGVWYNDNNFLSEGAGQKNEYSNNGAGLASIIIAKASGMSYKDFVKKHILDPAGMTDSGWRMSDYDLEERSQLYLSGFAVPTFNLITMADGGFVTNIEDFSKYFQMLMDGYYGEDNIITAASYKEMMTKQFELDQGIFCDFVNDNLVGHSGGDPGVSTYAFFLNSRHAGAIIFLNTSDSKGINDLVNEVMKSLFEYSRS